LKETDPQGKRGLDGEKRAKKINLKKVRSHVKEIERRP